MHKRGEVPANRRGVVALPLFYVDGMKETTRAEWKELRTVVYSILVYFTTLVLIAAVVPLIYLLPTGIVVICYLMLFLTGMVTIIFLDHRPHHQGPPNLPLVPTYPSNGATRPASKTKVSTH